MLEVQDGEILYFVATMLKEQRVDSSMDVSSLDRKSVV